MDPDILPQFSTPELFLSAIISQSVWKRTLLPILLLPEHHSTDNQAFPAPTVLSVPPNALMEAVLGCPIGRQPAELQGLCGKQEETGGSCHSSVAGLLSLSIWTPRGAVSPMPGNNSKYFS